MAALQPAKPRLRRRARSCGCSGWCWPTSSARTSPSARIILRCRAPRRRTSGFVDDPARRCATHTALAVLAVHHHRHARHRSGWTTTPPTARCCCTSSTWSTRTEWIRTDQGPLRAPADGDLRMSAAHPRTGPSPSPRSLLGLAMALRRLPRCSAGRARRTGCSALDTPLRQRDAAAGHVRHPHRQHALSSRRRWSSPCSASSRPWRWPSS